MRLNDKTYPALAALETGDYRNFPVHFYFRDSRDPVTQDQLKSMALAAFEIYKQVAHRYYITHPFLNAIIKASDKIVESESYLHDAKPDCGILFSSEGFTLYMVNPGDTDMQLAIFEFSRTALMNIAIMKKDSNYPTHGRYYKNMNNVYMHDPELLAGWAHGVLVQLYFIHNCEIETVVVEPRQKHRDGGVKFFNESKKPFTILNCNWFTELIRTTPFTVNGFFRWQRCGENFSKKKLIWIEPFEKKGYHRKARKPEQEQN